MKLYPLIMRPYYRYGEATPWGGDGLHRVLDKEIPDERTGESLEISALPGMESTVENGDLAGKTLLEVFEAHGGDLTGLPKDAGFPLLAKLIHTEERPSVQVHPDDEYAKKTQNKLGKTEAWVIVYAPPGARLVTGVSAQSLRAFEQYVERDAIEECLEMREVKTGDVYYIPHGQIHASAEGVLLYEIQQSSDITYRFYDWNRVNAAGERRPLHLGDALQVARFDLKIRPLAGKEVCLENGCLTSYIAEDHFELWQASVAGKMKLPFDGRMQLLTALDALTIEMENDRWELPRGKSAVLPAALEGEVFLSGVGRAIIAVAPDGK